MPLFEIVIVLVVFCLVWFLISRLLLPRIGEPFRTIVIVICVLVLIFWLLGLVGIGPGIRW